MKHALTLTIALGVLTAASVAKADVRTEANYDELGAVGLGLSTGDAFSGVTGKVLLPGPWALQSTLGVGYVYGAGFNLSVDALYEFPRFYGNDYLGMNWYLGAGGTIGSGSWTGGSGLVAGGQVLGGYGLQFKKFPVEATAEVRPTLLGSDDSGPAHFAWYTVAFGARYFF